MDGEEKEEEEDLEDEEEDAGREAGLADVMVTTDERAAGPGNEGRGRQ
jgi:hypothetical protein